MSKRKFKKGQKFWTFDFDAKRKEWSVYQVVFVGLCSSACEIGEWCEVKRLDGTPDDNSRTDDLFENREDAVKALIASLKIARDSMHQGLEYHTKKIAQDWNAIDFCTDLIEQLEAADDQATS